MKLKFKVLILLITLTMCQQALATKIIITATPNSFLLAKQVKAIFIERYSIPKRLIILKERMICVSQENRYLELCINRKGELEELSKSNIKKIKKSLAIFAKPEFSDV